MPLKASVLIVTFNSEAYVADCLEALLADLKPDDEVIVVDNASTDSSVERARETGERVRVIASPVNRGYAGGNNLGAKEAQGDILILLNPDTRVHPGWRDALINTLADDTIGVVGSKGLRPDGTLQHAGGSIAPDTAFSTHIGDGESDTGQYSRWADVDYVSGFALATRRSLWEGMGGLFEDYFPAYYEEVDYCFRVRRLGLRIVYAPTAVATHLNTPYAGNAFWGPTFILRQRWLFALRHFDAAGLRSALAYDQRMVDWVDVGRLLPFVAVYAESTSLCAKASVARIDDATLGGVLAPQDLLEILNGLGGLFQRVIRRLTAAKTDSLARTIQLQLEELTRGQTEWLASRELRHRAGRWILAQDLERWVTKHHSYVASLQETLRQATQDDSDLPPSQGYSGPTLRR